MMALFDQEKAVEQFGYEKKQEGRMEGRKEGRMEGRKEGRMEGRKEGYNELLRDLVKAGELSPEKAAQYAKMVRGPSGRVAEK